MEGFAQRRSPRLASTRSTASGDGPITPTPLDETGARMLGKVVKIVRKRVKKVVTAVTLSSDEEPHTPQQAIGPATSPPNPPRKRHTAARPASPGRTKKGKAVVTDLAAAFAADVVLVPPPTPGTPGTAVVTSAVAAEIREVRVNCWTLASLNTAMEHLRAVDERLMPTMDAHGLPERLVGKGEKDMFHTLARNIIYQQLAGNAAAAIFSRFMQACKAETILNPQAVLATELADLRACGLSARKAEYVQDLARHFAEGLLSDELISGLDEEALVAELTKVKGIGRWTVDMFSMFQVGRQDVLPVGDLGVRKGMQVLYGLKELPSPEQMAAVAEKWRPYRSLGSYYMWQVVEAQKPSPRKVKAKK